MYSSIRLRHSAERKKAVCHRRQSAKVRHLIANYFIQEGYKQAAISLVQEGGGGVNAPQSASDMELDDASEHSQTPAQLSLPGFCSIDKRKRIKYLILKGDILQAVRLISVYYPTILDNDKLLLFKLLRLNLIEMIREHKFDPEPKTEDAERAFLSSVLSFVRENLISKITDSMELLTDLETTMSLLCFDFDPSKPAAQLLELPEQTRSLFDLSLRSECYRAVNQVILDSEKMSLSSSTPGVSYKGIPFVDLESNELDLLPEPKSLSSLTPSFDPSTIPGFHETSRPQGNTSKSLENIIAFAPTSEKPLGEASVPPKPTEEVRFKLSRLEEICRLWVATESMLASKSAVAKNAPDS